MQQRVCVEVGDADRQARALLDQVQLAVAHHPIHRGQRVGGHEADHHRREQLAQQYEGQIQVCKLNIGDAPELAAAFGVHGIPTLILFKDGQTHSRLAGLHDETQLSSWVRAAF